MVPGVPDGGQVAGQPGTRMARQRHRKTDSSRIKRTPHEQKLHALSRAGFRPDPFNTRQVNRQYRELQSTKHLIRRADKKTRDDAREHGFHVNHKGVVIDGPRDRKRQPIKGAKISVLRGGVVTTSVKQRRDFIYGFTRAEKKAFADDPAAAEKSILARLRQRFPTLKKSRKPQVRLQWGAYQATKEFSPSYFTSKYFATVSPEEKRRGGKQKRLDKLTGLHIVIHVPTQRKKGKKKK